MTSQIEVISDLKYNLDQASNATELFQLVKNIFNDSKKITDLIGLFASFDDKSMVPLDTFHEGAISGFMVLSCDKYSVSINKLDKELLDKKRMKSHKSRSITTIGCPLLIKVVSGHDLECEIWQSDTQPDSDGNVENAQMSISKKVSVNHDYWLELNGNTEAMVFRSAMTDVVWLAVHAFYERPDFLLSFHSDSGKLKTIISNNDTASRAEMLLYTLRSMGVKTHTPEIIPLINSRIYNIRWLAAQEVCRLDPQLGEDLLHQMRNHDKCKQIAFAADYCLKSIAAS